ncbi:MAG: hypothetical protein ACOY71_04730 [Gemmatimonadota bacterium]
MFACQWHLDIAYGTQAKAIGIMQAWGQEKHASSEFFRAKGTRLMTGYVGDSASHIIDEYLFATLGDFEAALRGMAAPQFKPHSDALGQLIVPGSQHWKIYRVVE